MLSQNGPIEGSVPASRPAAILADRPAPPDPEVPERVERARRRQFTVGYKLRILTEADAARTTGEIGALLRREGLYSSHLAAWRRQREEGILNALSPRRRGRPTSSPEQRELARLRQANERLEQRLAAAEAVIEIQKKVSLLLGLAEPRDASGERS
jgi:transposase